MLRSSTLFLIVLWCFVCANAQLSGNSGRGGVIGSNSATISSDGDSDDYFRGNTTNAVVMVVAGVMCGLLLLFTVGVIFILTCCKNKTGPMMERARGSMMWARGSLFVPSPDGRSGRSNSFLSPFRASRSRSDSNCGDKRYKISDVDCETASNSFLSPFRAARSRSDSNCGDKRYKISDVDCETANQLNGDQ
uniref:Uncharacterized protein n=1 Tax=Plectus sambesii TaxID=2011161 RepID=A0A914UJ42_9BILA